MNRALSLLSIVFLSLPAFGQYKGSISFTQQEVSHHKQEIQEFLQVAGACLEHYQEDHLDFYENNCRIVNGKEVCVSKYYGERRYSKGKNQYRPDGTPLEYLGTALQKIGFPASFMNKMENTSCVGMALDCLKQAFQATNQNSSWDKLIKYTRLNGVGGTALQDGLSKLGWKTYYWNPAPQNTIMADMKRWDEEEKNWKSKGYHVYRYNRVMKRGTYWFNKVDNATDLVGFGRGEPKILQDVPFWVGTAHTGYHVFPGSFGDVIEAHSTRHITSIDNLEFSRFSPFAKGGGPRWTATEKYRSGLISIPPNN